MKECDAVHFVGMTEEEELAEITGTGARTVKIIKPHADDAVCVGRAGAKKLSEIDSSVIRHRNF